jgi:hypothetical protein
MDTNLEEAIRAAIRGSGVGVHQLGAFSTVDKGILSRFLRGQRSMTLATAGRVLEALGCTVEVSRHDPGAPLKRVTRRRKRPRSG